MNEAPPDALIPEFDNDYDLIDMDVSGFSSKTEEDKYIKHDGEFYENDADH